MPSNPTSPPERDAEAQVPLDTLGAIYRADDYDLPLLLAKLAPLVRAKLAAYCYRKSHTHQLGLTIARSRERADLDRAAGELGAVIYGQVHLKPSGPAPQPQTEERKAAAPRKISLGGSASKGRIF